MKLGEATLVAEKMEKAKPTHKNIRAERDQKRRHFMSECDLFPSEHHDPG